MTKEKEIDPIAWLRATPSYAELAVRMLDHWEECAKERSSEVPRDPAADADVALKLAWAIRNIRDSLAHGGDRNLVFWALRAGYLARQIGYQDIAPDAQIGRRVRSAGTKTRQIREASGGLAAQHREMFENLAREVRARFPQWGTTAVRDAVVELVRKRCTGVPCSRRTLERLKIPS